ncbi:putative O-methyltransferase [Paraphaeosphaeria sporulosa]|uniref:Putative O-methyltransferase n=1 Tax=Paraphaeosphaeria sporulosa TaxID=1460663 RepID=A0A177CH13_9PLEO|nr:putative O-methyltransferase [Paraphaeosphaeria sporulosa]OAG06626.1 putative O-methyltransferase [Paraphaeosphaeria sporulosa]
MSKPQPKAESLAATISQNTAEISQYLAAQGLPELSFAPGALPVLDLPPHLQKARAELLDATAELHDLVTGPLSYLVGLVSPTHNILASIKFINQYQVASKIQADEEVSYEELAQRCNVQVDAIRRLLRLAIAFHIFRETSNGSVSHSAVSRCMLEMPLVNDWIGHFCDEVWPASPHTVDALMRWPNSEEPNETAFSLSQSSNPTLFGFLQGTPAKAERFTNAMKFLQAAPETGVSHLLKDLQWDTEPVPKRLVDIGGADGAITTAILRHFPTMTAVVQDLPNVIESNKVPHDLEGRLKLMSHDMFSPQPLLDADVYLLRSVLHDWSDKYCIRILRSIIPALKSGSKVILNEVCMPAPKVLSASQERLLRGYDLTMKQLFNSKERDAKEWESLFAAADTRFHIRRITCSPGSVLSVIEAVWTEGSTVTFEESL